MKKEVESDFINADTGIRIEQNGENKSLTRGEIVGLLKKQQEQIKQLSSGDRGFKIEFVPPNGEPKQLTVKELVELAQKQFNTILVQNNIINQMRNQLKELEKK